MDADWSGSRIAASVLKVFGKWCILAFLFIGPLDELQAQLRTFKKFGSNAAQELREARSVSAGDKHPPLTVLLYNFITVSDRMLK